MPRTGHLHSTGHLVFGTIDGTIGLFFVLFVLTCILLVPRLCSLDYSLDTSVRVQIVFRGDGPAYMCLGCEEAFLRPGTTADEWRSAVRCGIFGNTTARNFERLTNDGKCTIAAGVDTNGVSLGYCPACFKTLQPPPPSEGDVTCSSLLHSYARTARSSTVTPGPKCLDPPWGRGKAGD